MRKRRVLAGFFGILAAAGAAMTIVLALSAPGKQTAMLMEDPGIAACVRNFLNDLCQRNLEGASHELLGEPTISVAEDQTGVEKILWDRYWDGLEGTLVGDPYAQGSCLAVKVRVTYPDMEAVVRRMGTLTKELLEQNVSEAQNILDIYDAEGGYRQEILDEVLLRAAQMATEQVTEVREKDVILKLVYDEKVWKIVPGKELRGLLSGSMNGGQGE